MWTQFALYLVVGGLAFCVDMGVFVGLRHEGFALYPASIASFITATVANYFRLLDVPSGNEDVLKGAFAPCMLTWVQHGRMAWKRGTCSHWGSA
ncbi:MAG: hypothetical protein FJX35_22070, partial [Alphaproteobacteria bacterium]|nr:hypothetical protein [Alphaproteobacteria bacterium]